MAKTYEAMQKDSRVVTPPNKVGGQYFNLRNRKQIGDIEKTILRYTKKETNCKVFNFTSCRRQEGVTTIIANLISYLNNQQSDKKILLIDANFYQPNLHKVYNTSKQPGLNDYFIDVEQQISPCVTPVNFNNIFILPCGSKAERQAGNINQDLLVKFINEQKMLYDLILIDSPPILSSPDGLSTALAADVSFLVLRACDVQREAALKAKAYLQESECLTGGVILNRVRQVIPGWMYRII